MFNLFKSEQQVIQEIHNEFDTAEDRLLQQADSLLKELNIPTQTGIEQKADRLINLGFVNSEVVVKASGLKESADSIKNKIVSTREQAELIKYYKQNYPFQKFLTEQELERICGKYKLVFAPVTSYVKDVPEKNITEIERTPVLKSTDRPNNILKITNVKTYFSYNGNKIKDFILTKKEMELYKEEDSSSTNWYYLNNIYSKRLNKPHDNIIMNHTVVRIDKQGLFIAAPQSHFNLGGLKKQGKYSFLNITITEVKDPIVFRYVRGGVQVLSKWGLEASDELLVNEINN